MAGIRIAHASSVRTFASLPMGGSFDWLRKGNRVWGGETVRDGWCRVKQRCQLHGRVR